MGAAFIRTEDGMSVDYWIRTGGAWVVPALAFVVIAVTTTDGAVSAALPASPAVSSVLPGGRSVEVGTTATVFATMINTGMSALSGCDIVLPSAAPAGLSITYQTTNPATNAVTGTPNTPVTIAGNDGIQTFVLSFTSSTAVSAPGLALGFDCTGVQPVTSIAGVNTVDLLFSATPIADVIALSATATNNGIVEVPTGGAGAFAVASDNIGVGAPITVSADTGSAMLPLTATVCQTEPSTGQCMAPPAPTVTVPNFLAGFTPTFSIFVVTSAAIPFDPANSRVFVRFSDAGGTSHGSTSVAVETN
jgi:hypothetical protein